jgi:anti-anti-sigma factor
LATKPPFDLLAFDLATNAERAHVSGSGPPELQGPGAFQAFSARTGDGPVVWAEGELDVCTTSDMARVLSSACPGRSQFLTVDVSHLRFIDAAGLNLLVSTHGRLVADGSGGLVVRGAKGIVRRVFDVTGLASLLDDPGPKVPARHTPVSCAPGRSPS